MLAENEGQRIEREAYATDLSDRGLRLQTDIPLKPGQIVDVTPTDALEYSMRGRVVWIGEPLSDQAGEAGLEFLRPIPAPA